MNYNLVAVKRDWIPERIFRFLCNVGLPWFGQLILYIPFRWIVFRKPFLWEVDRVNGD